MATGNYSITPRNPAQILTALEYNADHVNHITNNTPAGNDGYSDSLLLMQHTATPGTVGAESLASSLAGEFDRLRYMITKIKGVMAGGTDPAQWYSTPALNSAVKAIAIRATGQSIPSGAGADLSFSSAPFNDSAIWSGGSPTLFTAPADGIYYTGVCIRWPSVVADTPVLLDIVAPGVPAIIGRVSQNPDPNPIPLIQTIAGVYKLLATETIKFHATQTTGSPVVIDSTTTTPYSMVAFFVQVGLV